MKLYKFKNLVLAPVSAGRLHLDFNEAIQSVYPAGDKYYKWEVTKNLYGKGIIPGAFDRTLTLNTTDFAYSPDEKKYSPKPGGNYYSIKDGDVFLCHAPLYNLVAVVQAPAHCEIQYANCVFRKIEQGVYLAFLPDECLPTK